MSKFLTAFSYYNNDLLITVLALKMYDVANDGTITPGTEVIVDSTNNNVADFVMTSPTTGVLAYATLDPDTYASTVKLRTIGISGGTTPTFGSAFTLASSGYVEVLPNYVGGIDTTPEGTLKIFDVGSGKFLITWIGQGDSQIHFELVTLSGSTFSVTASGYLTFGISGDTSYSYIQSLHVLSPTQFLVSGVNRSTYYASPDPVFGQTGSEDLGADFTAILTVSGSSISIGSFTYPVTPAAVDAYLTGRSIPSDYNTLGIGYNPEYRRRVITSKLLPAGSNHYILVRQFGYSYYTGGWFGGYSYVHGIEFRPVSVSGTTVTIGQPATTLPWGINSDLKDAVAVETEPDSYTIFFTPAQGQPYGYWVDFNKTTNTLTERNLPPQIMDTTTNAYIKGLGFAQVSDSQFILFGHDPIVGTYRVSSILVDTSIPFYSYVDEDSGNRQNVAVKTGVSIMAWGEGRDERYSYRPVVVGADRSVTFKNVVRYPEVEPPSGYETKGYTFGDIAKLSEGKFITCSEEWSAIGTLNASNELTFGPPQPVPPTTNQQYNPPLKTRLVPLSETKVVALFMSDQSDYGITDAPDDYCLGASIGTISGNTVSWTAPTLIWAQLGWETTSWWESNPESYRIPGVLLSEDRILTVIHDTTDDVLYGINQFLILKVSGSTITVTPSTRLDNVNPMENSWDDPDTGIYYDGYSLIPAGEDKAVFLFNQEYVYQNPGEDATLFAQVVTITGDSVVLGEKTSLIPNPAVDYDVLYAAQGVVFGYGAWLAVRARPYNWTIDPALPAIVIMKIDGDVINLVSSTRYDDIDDNYGGAISAPRENIAFLWTMDWQNEFGSTDRALSKIIYLT